MGGDDWSNVKVFSQQCFRHHLRRAMHVKIGRVPATRAHIDPAFELEFSLQGGALWENQAAGPRQIFLPAFNANTVIARVESNFKLGGNVKVLFASLVI